MTSPYERSKAAGYSDSEIINHLQSNSKYSEKILRSKQAGYSDEEIGEFLSNYNPQEKQKPEKSTGEKVVRSAEQFALGLAQGSPSGMAYDLAVAPLAQKEAQTVNYRQGVFEDIERLQEQKQTGVWDEQDQELLDNLINQVKNPKEMEPFVKTADVSIRGLAEKATGQDLHPEGMVEKGLNWMGMIRKIQVQS